MSWVRVADEAGRETITNQTVLAMTYDRNGRRIEYVEAISNLVFNTCATNSHLRFVYDGYLCLQRLNAAASNVVTDLFEWDPTELVATRPLYWQRREASGNYSLFYTHDGNKNVSDVVFYQRARGIDAHYEYAPFGAITAASKNAEVTVLNFIEYNPFRFSSEYYDATLYLLYFNNRHYLGKDGFSWKVIMGLFRDGIPFCFPPLSDFLILLKVFVFGCCLVWSVLFFVVMEKNIQITLPYAIGITWGLSGIFVSPCP